MKGVTRHLKMEKQVIQEGHTHTTDGGCVGGPLSITRSPRNVFDVDKYGNSAREKNIDGSVRLYKMTMES